MKQSEKINIDFEPDESILKKIKKLENSKEIIKEINKNLSHSIMSPLNSVCMIPSKIIQTNHVII